MEFAGFTFGCTADTSLASQNFQRGRKREREKEREREREDKEEERKKKRESIGYHLR